VSLGLENRHAKPDVVTALLKAEVNQEPDQQYWFRSTNDWLEAASGAMITAWNERLLRAMLGVEVDLNRQIWRAIRSSSRPRGGPRVMLENWPADALLALAQASISSPRGPHSVRHVSEKRERLHDEIPPELAESRDAPLQ
jgi:hypothetical protein